MFNRVELKDNAKKILRKNYWWIVLVTLIFGIVSGSGTGLNFNINFSNNSSEFFPIYNNNSDFNNGIIDEFGNVSDQYDNGLINFGKNYRDIYYKIRAIINEIPAGVIAVFSSVFLAAAIITVLLGAFVLNPLHVGCKRWFVLNRREKAEMREIVHVFNHGYTNVVKIMFCKELFIFLWSLLLIVPGIIKSYEYRMIPFLLAENPEMDMQEAFERSRKLMNGNKWEAFVLDLSFLGWLILASFTWGILNVLYVAPYMELTNTELYVCLCQGRGTYTNENYKNNNAHDNQNNYDNNQYEGW